jgi:hypothetical protein
MARVSHTAHHQPTTREGDTVSTRFNHAPTVVIRAARGSDGSALVDLARLDSQVPLAGDVMIAEQDGSLVAALAGDRVIADPFRPTDDVVALLRLRARAGHGRLSRRGRPRMRVPRARLA